MKALAHPLWHLRSTLCHVVGCSAVTVEMPGPPLELRKRRIAIAVGILQLPTPMVRTHLLQGPRRFPTQRFFRKRRVGITDGDIACPAFPDFIGNRSAAHRLECTNDLQNAAALTCSKIDREHPGLSQVTQGA